MLAAAAAVRSEGWPRHDEAIWAIIAYISATIRLASVATSAARADCNYYA